MNTKEWATSQDSRQMLTGLAKRASARKLRLFACACCRRVWEDLEDENSRAAVESAERFADETISKDVLSAAQSAAHRATQRWYAPPLGIAPEPNWRRAVASTAAKYAAQPTEIPTRLARAMVYSAHYALLADNLHALDATAAQIAQCNLLRDIFGNPFLLVLFSAVWRTDTAVSLARQMYESREFIAMPILADSLQDAGCDSDDILSHCREPGEHVRGCWVVDLVLAKP